MQEAIFARCGVLGRLSATQAPQQADHQPACLPELCARQQSSALCDPKPMQADPAHLSELGHLALCQLLAAQHCVLLVLLEGDGVQRVDQAIPVHYLQTWCGQPGLCREFEQAAGTPNANAVCCAICTHQRARTNGRRLLVLRGFGAA